MLYLCVVRVLGLFAAAQVLHDNISGGSSRGMNCPVNLKLQKTCLLSLPIWLHLQSFTTNTRAHTTNLSCINTFPISLPPLSSGTPPQSNTPPPMFPSWGHVLTRSPCLRLRTGKDGAPLRTRRCCPRSPCSRHQTCVWGAGRGLSVWGSGNWRRSPHLKASSLGGGTDGKEQHRKWDCTELIFCWQTSTVLLILNTAAH